MPRRYVVRYIAPVSVVVEDGVVTRVVLEDESLALVGTDYARQLGSEPKAVITYPYEGDTAEPSARTAKRIAAIAESPDADWPGWDHGW